MTDYTNNFSLPFPEGRDEVAVHTDVEKLAIATDAGIGGAVYQQGTQLRIVERKTEALSSGDDKSFRVLDSSGKIALEVTPQGDTKAGSTRLVESEGFRVRDTQGRVALEVTPDGTTHVYDLVEGNTGSAVDTLHVFLAVGQSNMSGRGLPTEGAPQSPRVLQYGATRRELETATVPLDMVDSASGTSPATYFAHNYLATQPPNVGVLLIPAARGGTGFRGSPTNPADDWTWVKDASQDPLHALYNRSVEQTLEALSAARAQGYQTHVKGVLWHQGEGNGGTSPETYANHLDGLVQNYRDDLDAPTLPVMIGQMAPEGVEASSGGRALIDLVHQQTPQRMPYTGFAPATREGHNPGDTTHFSTVGTAYLGDTYLTAYTQALSNTHAPHGITVDTSVGTRVFVGDTMVHGDTGNRIVTDAIKYENGWLDGFEQIRLQRSGNIVHMTVTDLRQSSSQSGNIELFTLPVGFRTSRAIFSIPTLRGNYARISNGVVAIQNPSTSLDYFFVTFITPDPWPSMQVGTPG